MGGARSSRWLNWWDKSGAGHVGIEFKYDPLS
jgi:hypothetical protein